MFGNTEVVAQCISKGTNIILDNNIEYTRWSYSFKIIAPEQLWGVTPVLYNDMDEVYEVGIFYEGVYNRQKGIFVLR